MSRTVAIVDLETTGLSPELHEAWEFGVILLGAGGERTEHLYRIEPDLAKADPRALQVNRYYERTTRMRHRDTLAHNIAGTPANRGACWSHPPALALELARLLGDVTFLASNPVFDAGFLTAFLRRYGQAPTWNYRVRDFASIAWGWLHNPPAGSGPAVVPIGSQWVPRHLVNLDAGTADFARALGLDPFEYEAHTARGDCRMVADALDVIEGRRGA